MKILLTLASLVALTFVMGSTVAQATGVQPIRACNIYPDKDAVSGCSGTCISDNICGPTTTSPCTCHGKE